MFKKTIMITGLAVAALMSGCASAPQNAAQSLQRMKEGAGLPTNHVDSFSEREIAALAKQRPTEAFLLSVLASPSKTVKLQMEGAAGVIPVQGEGEPTHQQKMSGLGAVSSGIAVGGKLGAASIVSGLLMDSGKEARREGFMPTTTEPTLDFYRPLTPEERQTPLNQQASLYQEELNLLAAILDGKQASCFGVPCMKINWSHLHTGAWHQQDFYDYPAAFDPTHGGFLVTNDYVANFAEKALPVGDNGFMQLGIDPETGWAIVQPSMLPDNAFYSIEKLDALVKRHPFAANWYAVFNTPAPDGKFGVVWTVVHQGKIVGTGEIAMQ